MTIMGCCFSSCRDNEDAQGSEYGDRQRLLSDPYCNSAPVTPLPNSDSHSAMIAGAEGQQNRGQDDELQRILQETASSMIDVSGSGSHSLDHREFQERTRHYLQKVQSLSPALLRHHRTLLCDQPHAPADKADAASISQEDLDLMTWATSEVEEALYSIRVEHCEDLVVPFGCHTPSLQSSPSP